MGPKEISRSAPSRTERCRPREPPMTKTRSLFPASAHPAKRSAKSCDEINSPSIANATVYAPVFRWRFIFSASFSLTASPSAGEALGGSFSSGTSTISIFAYGPSRLRYSLTPSVRYFSLIFPTATILICKLIPSLNNIKKECVEYWRIIK